MSFGYVHDDTRVFMRDSSSRCFDGLLESMWFWGSGGIIMLSYFRLGICSCFSSTRLPLILNVALMIRKVAFFASVYALRISPRRIFIHLRTLGTGLQSPVMANSGQNIVVWLDWLEWQEILSREHKRWVLHDGVCVS